MDTNKIDSVHEGFRKSLGEDTAAFYGVETVTGLPGINNELLSSINEMHCISSDVKNTVLKNTTGTGAAASTFFM